MHNSNYSFLEVILKLDAMHKHSETQIAHENLLLLSTIKKSKLMKYVFVGKSEFELDASVSILTFPFLVLKCSLRHLVKWEKKNNNKSYSCYPQPLFSG